MPFFICFCYFLHPETQHKRTDDDNDDDNLKSISAISINKHYKEDSKDNLFREFRRICADIADESSYLGKTKILHTFLLKVCLIFKKIENFHISKIDLWLLFFYHKIII